MQSLSRRLVKSRTLLLMLLPCLAFFAIFHYLPMFGVVISFKDYNLFRGVFGSDWVGLKHYRTFFQSRDMWILVRNTFLLGFYSLVFGFPAPILLALSLNEVRRPRFKRLVQTVSYLPHFLSNVIVASMVIMFLSPSSGLVNKMIEALGMEAVNFMVKPGLFRPIYVISGIWQQMGFAAIIYLAALSSIPPELYEAAEIDGAGRLQRLWHVTLPGISETIVMLFILNTGTLMTIGFEKVFLLYNPAIYETADILSTYVYRIGLVGGNFSYAAAIDMFTSVVAMTFLLMANAMSRKFAGSSLW